jgi:hypothetical protein
VELDRRGRLAGSRGKENQQHRLGKSHCTSPRGSQTPTGDFARRFTENLETQRPECAPARLEAEGGALGACGVLGLATSRAMRAGSCPARFALSVCLLLLAPAMFKPAAGGDAGAQAAVLLEFTAPAVVLRGVRTPVPFYLQVAGLPVNSSLFVEVRATRRDPGDTSPAAFGSFEAVVRGSGVFEVEDSVDMVSDPSLADFDVALLVRDGPNGTILTMATERPVRAIPSFLSILPAFLIVTVAIVTRNVVIALLAGLTLGGIFISPG